MGEEGENEKMDVTKFDIGFDANPPRVMLIQVPIGVYAEDEENGMALMYGKMREAQAKGAMVIKNMRMAKKQNGLVRPGPANLGVVS